MVPADSDSVASDDEVGATLLEFMYEQAYNGAYWSNFRDLIAQRHSTWGEYNQVTALWRVLDRLVAEGQIEQDVTRNYTLWYQLTTSQWLRMTRSKQTSLTISTR